MARFEEDLRDDYVCWKRILDCFQWNGHSHEDLPIDLTLALEELMESHFQK